MALKKIAIMASGSGTNAQRIIEHFSENENIRVDCLLSNNPQAFALERAKNANVPSFVFNRQQFYHTNEVVNLLSTRSVDVIVLAGFLWLVPSTLVANYPILNIHPALLPSYGGKNMYGMNVHKAVLANKEKESGITIHKVNEQYDEGDIVFQARCPVSENDTPETLAERVHQLEYLHYPLVIEEFISLLK